MYLCMPAAIINYCTVFYVLACVYGECLYNMYKDNTGTKHLLQW